MSDPNTIFSSIGLSTLATVSIGFLARHWISERLKQSIQHEYDHKLELHKANLKAEHEIAIVNLKAEITRDQAISATATASFHEAHRIGLERRLNSIEVIWGCFLKRDASVSPLVFAQDILTVEEYPKLFSEDQFSDNLNNISLMKITQNLTNTQQDADSHRLFVGEYLWQLFFAYRALNGRLELLVLWGKDPENRTHWTTDSGIRRILESVLTKEKVHELYDNSIGACRRMNDLIKQKYLATAAQILSGESSASGGLDQARKISIALSKVSNDKTSRSS